MVGEEREELQEVEGRKEGREKKGWGEREKKEA